MKPSDCVGRTWTLGLEASRFRNSLHRTSEGLVLLPPKTKRSRRSIPLPKMVISTFKAPTATACRGWRECGLAQLGFRIHHPLGTPIDPRELHPHLPEAMRGFGVPVVPLHAMRHTCVSLLLSMDVPPRVVMEIAGPQCARRDDERLRTREPRITSERSRQTCRPL